MFWDLFTLFAVVFPFLAMVLMWRRMKRVRASTYHATDPSPRDRSWHDEIGERDGLTIAHGHAPNEELIKLGDRAQHGRWPIDNG